MNILWVPQISCKSSDGKILLNKDSNMSVIRNLINSDLCKENNIIIAFEFDSKNCIIDDVIKDNFTLCFNDNREFTNAYMERFCFDYTFFNSIKEAYNIDLVFVNEPTKVIPLKKIFGCKIATYVHWLAFKNMPEITWRQYEGINASDICFANSNYAIDEIIAYYRNYNLYFNNRFEKAQPSFIGEVSKKRKIDADFAFIYNHRLSTDEYYSLAFESLIKICEVLEDILDKMPTIYLTNPSGKDVNVNKDYFKIIDLSSQEVYNNFLSSNNIMGHINTFFVSKGMWSMSTVDCAAKGNICLLPKKYGYAEIFDKYYYGYCANETDMIYKIFDIANDKYELYKYNNNSIANHSAKIVGNKMNKILQELAKEN